MTSQISNKILTTFVGCFLTLLLMPLTHKSVTADDADDKKESATYVDGDYQADSDAVQRVGQDIQVLASEEFGGRQPGTPQMQLAEDYLVAQYKAIGLQPANQDSFLQTFEVGRTPSIVPEQCSLTLNGPDGKTIELEMGKEFQTLISRGDYELESELVFVGYGINAEELNFDEFASVDVEGKIVVLVNLEPAGKNENSVFSAESPTRYSAARGKAGVIRRLGAAGIIMVNATRSAPDAELDELVAPDFLGVGRIPFAQVKRQVVDQIFSESPIKTPTGDTLNNLAAVEDKIDETVEPLSQVIDGWSAKWNGVFEIKGAPTSNVVGVIEGEGPHAHETIVIGGHYDHLGRGAYGSRAPGNRNVHYGADDNASGTAAVLELARRFTASDQKPQRRMVFICFTAEEMGLLGARHYVDNPLFPLEDTVAMFNFDMIGWLRDDQLQVVSWDSSPEFWPILQAANEQTSLQLDRPTRMSGGSDHMPFNARQIPNIFFHTGLHEVYHTPGDTFEAINTEGAVRVIDYAEQVIVDTMARNDRLKYGKPEPFSLGISLDSDREEVIIESVNENSAAAKSGLLAGDEIIEIDGQPISSRRELTRSIRANEGSNVIFTLKRQAAVVKLHVKLEKPE